MSNKEVYKKTLVFSIRRLLFSVICIVLVGALAVFGFVLLDKLTDKGLIGLGIGVVLGIIIVAVLAHFIAYTYSAGQIAMMTRAVTEGTLPDDVYGEGKKIVKERFITVAGFYAATSLIKGIFNQIGNGITNLGGAIGGDTGRSIGSAISIGIQVVVGFLCDCCLGWVFYRKDKGAVKATIEGAGIFFKNGKALIKNLGRIFGIGLASFVAIGGAFTGLFYLILSQFPDAFRSLSNEIVEALSSEGETVSNWITNPTNLTLIAAAILGIVLWSIIHGTFIRPFILVGVLRNFMEAGLKKAPTEEDYQKLEKVSGKFAKLRKEEGEA